MAVVKVDLNKLPKSVGTTFVNGKTGILMRYYDDAAMGKAWQYVLDEISTAEEMGQIDEYVDLKISGFMPDLMKERFSAWCVIRGIRSYYKCTSGGLEVCVYDMRNERVEA